MKRFLVLAVVVLLSGCGSDVAVGAGDDSTPDPVATAAAVSTPGPTETASTPTPAPTPDPEPTATPTPDPGPTATVTPDDADVAAQIQRDALTAARARWQANRPASYSFTYFLQCECDQGPWRVTVDIDGNATTEHLGEPGVSAEAHYLSIDELFDGIEDALDDGTYPVEVTYDPTTGVPIEYVYNRPELPIDGGFVLVVDKFAADAGPERDADRAALAAARVRWDNSGLTSQYDYTFRRNCFCPPEYTGPYQASVIDGKVVAASYQGVDLLDIEALDVDDYALLVLTVHGVFDEIERAIGEADSYTVEYHAELGYPTNLYVDWSLNIADEEASYQISDLISDT